MWQWKKLGKEERGQKWIIEFNNVLLASVFHRESNGKYSVYVYTPMIFQKVLPMVGQTWLFGNLKQAQEHCERELEDTVVPWSKAMIACWEQKESNETTA